MTCPRSHRLCTSLPAWAIHSYLGSSGISLVSETLPGNFEPALVPGRVFSSQNGSLETRKDVSPIFTDRCLREQKHFHKNTNTEVEPPLEGLSRRISGGVQVDTKQHWMECWLWWPLKESHPPHGCHENLTPLSPVLSFPFRSSFDSQTWPVRRLDSIILHSHLPPIWSGGSTRVGPGHFDFGTCHRREVIFSGLGSQARPQSDVYTRFCNLGFTISHIHSL